MPAHGEIGFLAAIKDPQIKLGMSALGVFTGRSSCTESACRVSEGEYLNPEVAMAAPGFDEHVPLLASGLFATTCPYIGRIVDRVGSIISNVDSSKDFCGFPTILKFVKLL